MNVAEQIVETLEERGIEYVFGLPGEENIVLVNALNASEKIQFILVHDEQAATFMAEMIGWLTNKPGVTIATLGPGALNMAVSIADAQSHSFPLIAIAAQAGIEDTTKETTQVFDLKQVYAPLTKWSENVYTPESTAHMINKAYNLSVSGRPGATFLTVPAPFEEEDVGDSSPTVIPNPKEESVASEQILEEAVKLIKEAEHPVVLTGLGIAREKSAQKLRDFVKKYDLPVVSSYMAKGVIPDDWKQSLGVVGFIVDDYINQYLADADLILAVGYEFTEFDAEEFNPKRDKKIIHIHSFNQDTDKYYPVSTNVIGKIGQNLALISQKLGDYEPPAYENTIRPKLEEELEQGSEDSDIPLTPYQLVHATRAAVGEDTMTLVDTGAVKMWMARLFPTYEPNSVLINNGLSSMAWTIPGTIATKLLYPEKPVLTIIGDGSFHMHVQELAVAKRYDIPMTILIWDDSGYGLIKWKMDISLGKSAGTDFENPDFKKIAEAYGGEGYVVKSRDDLEETLKKCLAEDSGINIIVAPVDYSENMKLIEKLEKELG
jgi:acetolactate synthase-1/2/3 large subunit